MTAFTTATLTISGRTIEYRVVPSKAGKHLRVRVGPAGVEVIRPISRPPGDVALFVAQRAQWIVRQLDLIAGLRAVRLPSRASAGVLLLHGAPTRVRLAREPHRRIPNRVLVDQAGLTIVYGGSATPPARSLENWLRQQARGEVAREIERLSSILHVSPGRLYVKDPRTKWGSCSALKNISLSWRCILAPPFVLQYLVTHEVVHLAVPDHSRRFWLTVTSICPETDRARQWLSANSHLLLVDLTSLLNQS